MRYGGRQSWMWHPGGAGLSATSLRVILVGLLSACIGPHSGSTGAIREDIASAFQHHIYQVGDRRIHYVASGDGPSRVLFLHGSPGAWTSWTPFLSDARLRARTQMLAVDRPGWGESGVGQVVPSLGAQAELLGPLISNSDQPTLLVAHSYGAAIAAQLAMNQPAAIRGIVLIAPAISPDLPVERWYDRLAKLPVVRWLLSSQLALAYVELGPLQDELEALRRHWGSLTMPVTIIQGADDWEVDPRTVDFARKQLCSSDLKTTLVEGQGHRVLWNRSGLVIDEVLNAIERTRDAPSRGAVPAKPTIASCSGAWA